MPLPRRGIIAVVCLSVLLLVLATVHGIIDRQVRQWKPRLVEYVRLHYGVACELGELEYVFPDGIRTTGLKIVMPDQPLLAAAEATVRIRVMKYLRQRAVAPDLLKSIQARGLQIHLRRSSGGAWLLPVRSVRSPAGEQAEDAYHLPDAPIRVTIDDLDLAVSTPKGSLQRRYDRFEARYDPGPGTGRFHLKSGGENVKIDFRTGPERSAEINADPVSLQPLLLLASPGLPLERVLLRGKAKIRENAPGKVSWQAAGEIFARPPDDALKINLNMEGKGGPAGWEEISGQAALGQEKVDFSVKATRDRKPRVNIVFFFPDFSFARFIAAVPPSFRPHLPELQVTGHLRGSFSASLAAAPPYRTEHRFTGELQPLRIVALGPQLRIDERQRSFRHTFRTDDGRTVSMVVGPENPDFIPYAAIPDRMIRAVVTAEDGGFFRHRGISINQLIEATADNLRAGRVVRGASTITMQLAKNLYLSRERTFSRKFEELFITLALEQELSKQRIMEIYLNIIEWGEGIYGLVPAARHYFHKAPGELTDRECAFLASIIARPTDDWPEDPLPGLSAGWQQYLDLIVRKMAEKEIPAPE